MTRSICKLRYRQRSTLEKSTLDCTLTNPLSTQTICKFCCILRSTWTKNIVWLDNWCTRPTQGKSKHSFGSESTLKCLNIYTWILSCQCSHYFGVTKPVILGQETIDDTIAAQLHRFPQLYPYSACLINLDQFLVLPYLPNILWKYNGKKQLSRQRCRLRYCLRTRPEFNWRR